MSEIYRDSTRSIGDRVADLLSRMTLEEKIGQMSVRMGSGESPRVAAEQNNRAQADAIAHCQLGIPLLLTRESSHGLNTAGVTSFPACIALASSFDEDLNYRVGRTIAREARAQGVHQGLSPVLDIARDPRWGRMEETYGEDALLTSRLGVAFIRGLQGDHLRDGIVATPKHFVGYGDSEGGKDNDPISITDRDLHETYLPPFKAAVQEAKCESIMICFGALNGVPCTSDNSLVTDMLREWSFDGHVVDDCPGIAGLLGHRTARDMPEAIAQSINAGIDRQFYDFIGLVADQIAGQKEFERILLQLVRGGKVPESRIDDAAARVLRSKFRLGLFDSVQVDPDQAERVANDPSHRALAREAAVKGIVLLKNENDLLPLKTDLKTIVVIGPNVAVGQLGDYSGRPDHVVSPLEAIRDLLGSTTEIIHAAGCEILSPAMIVGRFSVRLSGNLTVPTTADYHFSIESNDGVRVTLGNQRVIDDWSTGARRKREATLKLSKGPHAIMVEYFKGTRGLVTEGDAAEMNRNVLRMSWAPAGAELRPIPQDAFTYSGQLGVQQHGSGEGLMMDAFLGQNFDQPMPEQSRVVRSVDFDWGEASPILAREAESHEQQTIREAVEAARRAEVVLLFVGETSHRGAQQVCGEHFDRADLGLTGAQDKLVREVIAVGKPTVLVLINGRSLAIPHLIDSVPAVLECWYPGQEGGHAIADVLFGGANPSGKLPVSIPYSSQQLPVYYNRRPRMGWYIDSRSEPMFPFGFGLSYTTFEYENLRVMLDHGDPNQTFEVSIDVRNTGRHAGEEVVQLYVEPVTCSFATPVKRLADFKRVSIQAAETATVRFNVSPSQLAMLDRNGKPRIEPGEHIIHIGSSSAHTKQVRIQIA
jgi:beta-glucosidase